MKRILIILSIVFLFGCSYSAPVYFTNTTDSDVLVISGEVTYTVKPGKAKKIRGAHYEKLAIKFGDGNVKAFTEDDLGFLKNWQEYQGKYICSSFWGTKININIAPQNQLVVQPCNNSNVPMVL